MKRDCNSRYGLLRYFRVRRDTKDLSLIECGNDQIHIRFCRNMPCDNVPGEQIHYNTKIIPFTVSLDIDNATDP